MTAVCAGQLGKAATGTAAPYKEPTVKAITLYEANDGSRFASQAECLAYESEAKRIADAMAPLGDGEIAYRTFRQHDSDSCLSARRGLVMICRELWPEESVFRFDPDVIHPCSYAGRFIDDAASTALRRAWGRLMRINWENFREYCQPYYAAHPNELATA